MNKRSAASMLSSNDAGQNKSHEVTRIYTSVVKKGLAARASNG